MEHGPALSVSPKTDSSTPGVGPAGERAQRGVVWERHGVKLALSLVLGVGIAWVLSRGGLPVLPERRAFAALKVWTVPAYVLSLAVLHYFRAIRWRYLLRPV